MADREFIYLVTDDIQLTPICEDCGPNLVPVMRKEELIRCKDCIRWRKSKSNTAAKVCDWDRYEKTENDYCSWAKRSHERTKMR